MKPAKGSSLLRSNLRYSLIEALFAVPCVFLAAPGNVVMTVLLTRYFQLSGAQFGLLVALPALFNALQLAVIPVLQRRYTARQVALGAGWLHALAMFALAAVLPYLRTDGGGGVFFILLFFMGLQAGAMAIAAVSWTSWAQEFTPERIRGNYFGRRNRAFQLVTVVFLVAMGWWLTRQSEGGKEALLWGLVAVLGLSMVSRFNSLRLMARTQSPVDVAVAREGMAAVQGRSEAGRSWRWQLQRVLVRPQFLRYLGFGAAFGFTSGLMGPFFNVFMLEVLKMSVGQVTAVVVLSSVTGAAAMAGWGPFIDRYGNRPVMVFCLTGWMVNGYLWTVTTPERLWVLYMAWAVAGVFAAGFMQGLFGLLLKIVPPEAKSTAISINVAVTALPATVAPVLAGTLLDAAVAQGWDKLAVYQWGSALHHTLVLSTVFLLLRVEEPKSQPLSQLVGAMRSYRNIVAVLGLSFIGDYRFYRRRDE